MPVYFLMRQSKKKYGFDKMGAGDYLRRLRKGYCNQNILNGKKNYFP